MINETAARAATDQTTSEVYVVLMTISSPDLSEDLRFTLDDQDIISNGLLYRASGFGYKPPPQGEQTSTVGQLRVDNVDRAQSQAVKESTVKPSVILVEVLASDPDTIIKPYPPFKLFNVSWNFFTMEGTIGLNDDQDEASVSYSYSAKEAPALYA